MKKLDFDIKQEYSHELNAISNILVQLENGRIYELSHSKMDGSLATNVQKLKKEISGLLSKIQDGKDGTAADLAKWFI